MNFYAFSRIFMHFLVHFKHFYAGTLFQQPQLCDPSLQVGFSPKNTRGIPPHLPAPGQLHVLHERVGEMGFIDHQVGAFDVQDRFVLRDGSQVLVPQHLVVHFGLEGKENAFIRSSGREFLGMGRVHVICGPARGVERFWRGASRARGFRDEAGRRE